MKNGKYADKKNFAVPVCVTLSLDRMCCRCYR